MLDGQPDLKHEVTLKYRKILALFIIGNKTIAILFQPRFSVCLNEKSCSDYKAQEHVISKVLKEKMPPGTINQLGSWLRGVPCQLH